jgi:hypothetical protein
MPATIMGLVHRLDQAQGAGEDRLLENQNQRLGVCPIDIWKYPEHGMVRTSGDLLTAKGNEVRWSTGGDGSIRD